MYEAAGAPQLAFDAMDKFNVPTPRSSVSGPLPLSHVYLLEKGQPGETAFFSTWVEDPELN